MLISCYGGASGSQCQVELNSLASSRAKSFFGSPGSEKQWLFRASLPLEHLSPSLGSFHLQFDNMERAQKLLNLEPEQLTVTNSSLALRSRLSSCDLFIPTREMVWNILLENALPVTSISSTYIHLWGKQIWHYPPLSSNNNFTPAISTKSSQAISLSNTVLGQCCLTSVFEWKLVYPTRHLCRPP